MMIRSLQVICVLTHPAEVAGSIYWGTAVDVICRSMNQLKAKVVFFYLFRFVSFINYCLVFLV